MSGRPEAAPRPPGPDPLSAPPDPLSVPQDPLSVPHDPPLVPRPAGPRTAESEAAGAGCFLFSGMPVTLFPSVGPIFTPGGQIIKSRQGQKLA